MSLFSEKLDSAGFDSAAGLRIVGGNADRYAKLLRKFADRQNRTIEEIRSALETGDRSAAERAAHSLKGSASTLGANALAQCAAETEIALRSGQGVDEALANLSESLSAVMSAIERAVPD